jgi:hypothetical protein
MNTDEKLGDDKGIEAESGIAIGIGDCVPWPLGLLPEDKFGLPSGLAFQ